MKQSHSRLAEPDTIVNDEPCLYDINTVIERTSLSRALYHLHKQAHFPKPFKIGTRTFWTACEVHAWMQERLIDRAAYAPDAPLPLITSNHAFIPMKAICARLALSRWTIGKLESQGTFPVRIKLGKHRLAWLNTEIDDWLESNLGQVATIPIREALPALPLEPAELPVNPFITRS